MRLTTIGLTAAIALAAAPALPALADSASATLKNTKGETIGSADIAKTESGVILIKIEARGIPEGVHGVHVHETGDCSGEGFKLAGGHLGNGADHGVGTSGGPHPGDLPNAHVGADGILKVEYFTKELMLEEFGLGPLYDEDGSAIVIHAGADDYLSQPSGDAGDRIACGVIERNIP